MKKVGKSTKKGFTLVELIVVLVILAVLAAMLVPALTGYIQRARQEKDYQMAATVLTAVQSAATYQYSVDFQDATDKKITGTTPSGNGVTVNDLIGDTSKVSSISFTVNEKGIVQDGGSVVINGYKYTWNTVTASWSAAKAS